MEGVIFIACIDTKAHSLNGYRWLVNPGCVAGHLLNLMSMRRMFTHAYDEQAFDFKRERDRTHDSGGQ
jgi:hypothetical protein